MKSLRITAAALFALSLAVSRAPAAPAANPAWEKMKSLVGDWEGTAEGHPATVSYRLVSSGTALEESLSTPDGSNMVTIYHQDGPRLSMTHFCSENTQPRMRSAGLSPDGKRVEFTFVDVTNVASADASYMVGLAFLFQDADHMTQRWTHQMAKGKNQSSDFQFTRKK